MLHDTTLTLTDRLYEAAATPEMWPKVLAELAAHGDAEGGVLYSRAANAAGWISTPAFAEYIDDFVSNGWMERDGFDSRILASDHAGFMGDLDLFSAEELKDEPIYRDWLYPLGYGWGAETMMRMPQGMDPIFINLERRFERGPIGREVLDRLDAVRPHLARALFLSSRLGFEHARAASAALAVVGLPGAVLGGTGRVLVANDLFADLIPDLILDCRDRVRLTHAASDARLAGALAQLKAGSVTGACSIPMPARLGRPPLIFYVIPVRGMAHDIFSSAGSILVAAEVIRQQVPSAELLAALFNLSAAESRVARSIGRGNTVEGTAETLGVSRETVRTQLKAVLAKTGVGRQADLVALLAGVPLPCR